ESWNLRLVRPGQVEHTTVALLPGLDEVADMRLVLVERDRRRRVVHVPAEAAIVEVDHLDGRAVDQKVGEPEVAVDQAEAVRPLGEGGEPLADQRDGAAEQLRLRRVDAHAIAPAAPMRALL